MGETDSWWEAATKHRNLSWVLGNNLGMGTGMGEGSTCEGTRVHVADSLSWTVETNAVL